MPRTRRSRSRSRCARRCTTNKTAALVTPDRALARRVARRARALEHRGGRFRRRSRCPTPRPACSRGLSPQAALDGLAAGQAARAAQACALPAWRGGRRACARNRGTGAGDPARAAPAPGRRQDLRMRSRRSAPKDDLHPTDPRRDAHSRRRSRCRAGAGRRARRSAGAARSDQAHAIVHRDRRAACAGARRRCRATMPEHELAFAGDDGAELARAFEDIAEQRDDFARRAGRLRRPVRDRDRGPRLPPRRTPGARVRILGPLEARLVSVDRVVLGGLVEGVWPPETRSDPWLSRPMRLDLGLDLPERRVGLSAHDFAQLLGMPEVILTARRQARRRADGRVALHAAARGGRRRGALEGRARARRAISRLGARSRPRRHSQAGDASASAAAARRAPGAAERHRDRGLAARSLHDLRTGISSSCARSMPSTRRPARATAAP